MTDLRPFLPESAFSLFSEARSAPVFIVLDIDGFVVAWPVGAEALLGWSAEEAQGHYWTEILDGRDPLPTPLSYPSAESCHEAETSARYWQRCWGGAEIFIEDITSPLYGKYNELVGFGKSLRRVTDESIGETISSGDDVLIEQRQLEAAIAHAPVGVVVADARGVVLKMNDAHQRLWGIEPPVNVDLGQLPNFRAWHLERPGRPRRPLELDEWPLVRALKGQTVTNEIFEIETFDVPPERKIVQASSAAVRDKQGNIVGAVISAVDVTAQHKAEAIERDTSARLKFVMDASRIGDWDLDLVNDTAQRSLIHDQCFGYPEGAPHWGRETFLEHVHPGDRAWVEGEFAKAVAEGKDLDVECRVVWPDGSIHWIHAQGRFYASQGRLTRMTGIVQEVTERKLASQQILHASLHDPLTDLPNRAKLFEYSSHLLAHNHRSGQQAATFFLDLDRFKQINDSHGHAVGDALLQEVALRLRQCVRAEDFLVRLGGDEFLVLYPEIADDETAAEMARNFIERVSAPYRIQGKSLTLGISVGISLFPKDGTDIDTLISHADLAMYQAKQSGRGQYSFYSRALAADARLKHIIEHKLSETIRDKGFHLAYQPIFDLTSGEIVSVEALLRWSDTNIGPEQFVPVAEATGMIGAVGGWLLDEVADQYAAWQNMNLPPLPIAINISVVELRDHEFVDRFFESLAKAGLPPDAIQVELTETTAMDDIEFKIGQLSKLRSRGVTIALDDFGTGHSSLTYLARLPVNKVKIDKSFITGLGSNSVSQTITGAIVALSRNLGLDVVAEGVETQSTLEHARALGCQQGQGFHLARPMTCDDFDAWYRKYLRRDKTLPLFSS
ncbi:hypothetical protein RE428_12960 [Marinobacter nanhaiticus D15-8W]|uniref:GGDEF domain-containing protein n=1 Tax=Marinobacter nanhaiticus D15-8W TaxID=626887 RepID=N6WPD3_9GAMM|nr:EAL domain-containing protein [Marinobacter nanhaiticus]ENO12927.1 GGDEF domain-containing protein [Marinobacter nanhaiticus D15-8W]BES70278.1 hypothetical protein RE428_12960 [Marinobacter nanhaiticus D15-8W]